MYNHKFILTIFILLLVIMASCSKTNSEKETNEQTTNNDKDISKTQDKINNSEPPSLNNLDPGDEMTPFIERGKSLLDGSEKMSGRDEANKLSCLSCHSDGSETNGVSLVGIKSKYPKFDEREDNMISLAEKINYSVTRDLAGEKLDYDGEEMRSIIAYLTFISEGLDHNDYKDKNKIKDIPVPNLDNGEKIYKTKLKDTIMWGKGSFTDGSNMNRMSIISNYVKNHLPQNNPGSLSDQDAADISGYILSKNRPIWKENDSDWGDGKIPNDLIDRKAQKKIQENDFDWSVINQD